MIISKKAVERLDDMVVRMNECAERITEHIDCSTQKLSADIAQYAGDSETSADNLEARISRVEEGLSAVADAVAQLKAHAGDCESTGAAVKECAPLTEAPAANKTGTDNEYTPMENDAATDAAPAATANTETEDFADVADAGYIPTKDDGDGIKITDEYAESVWGDDETKRINRLNERWESVTNEIRERKEALMPQLVYADAKRLDDAFISELPECLGGMVKRYCMDKAVQIHEFKVWLNKTAIPELVRIQNAV